MHQLLDCLSLALNLSSADSLSRHHATSSFTFDLLHYPAISRRLLSSGDLTRVPAHSDTGTLTLLFQDSVGGLEVADPNSANTVTSVEFEKNGTFKHVQPVPGAIVVNVGYLLMRWSNGRWKNTVHRVVAPPLHASGQEPVKFESTKLQGKDEVDAEDVMAPARFSIPFFSSPDPDTIVEALPGCWDDEVQKKWKPMHAGNYLRRKRDAAYP
jgi:isopenicillin N synthase-like dioxygenase